jgi:hypothetical protein
MLGAMLWGCVGASEPSPDALASSAADAKSEEPGARAIDTGWAPRERSPAPFRTFPTQAEAESER